MIYKKKETVLSCIIDNITYAMPPKLRRSSKQTPMPQKRRTSTETTESQQGSSSEMPTEPQI